MSEQETPKPDFNTAFIVVGLLDGTYAVLTDLTSSFSVATAASDLDIKRACREISDRIVREEIVQALK